MSIESHTFPSHSVIAPHRPAPTEAASRSGVFGPTVVHIVVSVVQARPTDWQKKMERKFWCQEFLFDFL
jgi:hypothetical protein